MRLSTFPLIVAVLLALASSSARADDWQPLTDAEVRAYMARIGEAGVIADIRRLDVIEHAVPVLEFPRLVGILTADGELVLWSLGLTDDIRWTIVIADLRYEVTMDPIRIEDFHRSGPTPWRWLLIPAAGAVSGVVGCLVGGGKPSQYAVAAGIGAGIGLVVAAVWPQ